LYFGLRLEQVGLVVVAVLHQLFERRRNQRSSNVRQRLEKFRSWSELNFFRVPNSPTTVWNDAWFVRHHRSYVWETCLTLNMRIASWQMIHGAAFLGLPHLSYRSTTSL